MGKSFLPRRGYWIRSVAEVIQTSDNSAAETLRGHRSSNYRKHPVEQQGFWVWTDMLKLLHLLLKENELTISPTQVRAKGGMAVFLAFIFALVLVLGVVL